MSWILGNWVRLLPWLGGVVLLLGGWAYLHHQNALLTSLRQNLAVAEANGALAEKLARDNAAALDIAAKQHVADMAAVQNHYRHQAAAEKATAHILESIDHAPSSDDGPVAPVLAHALDCLRQRAGDAPGARASDCSAQAPGSPADMPSSP
jgi:hypothetical protein